MKQHDTGGSAFPHHVEHPNGHWPGTTHAGMTLRDYFAAKAMPIAFDEYRRRTCKNNEDMGADWGTEYGLSSVAAMAFELADAMINERFS